MPNCIQCQRPFAITDLDRAFYRKIEVPEPTLCPACRQQRRLAHRNERTLYPRACDLCSKAIVSIYPAKTVWPVYCPACWWSDKWDGLQFGMNYDPTRPFFEQFKELQSRVPRISILSMNSENSDYTNNTADNKNCYLIFAAENNEDCYYGRLVQHNKNCVDCDYIYDSEKGYGCLDCRNCYNTIFAERCDTCTDVLFGFNLRGCSNCLLCTNLRNKDYHIENKPVSKEEFEKRRQEILASRDSLARAKSQFEEMKREALVKFATLTKCENSSGDYLFNCHDTAHSFDATNAKDCGFVNDALDPIDFYDGNNIYYKPELCYEIMGCLNLHRCLLSTYIFHGANLIYCDSCHNTNDALGCIGLKKNQFCILNKQYSEPEYQKLRGEIVERLKREKIWGEMLPVTLSPFAYNETHAMTYYPLTKEEVAARGWKWTEAVPFTYGKETIKPEAVPATIEEITDDILKQVLACSHCGRNYKITPQELDFYRTMHLPVPTVAPECRLLERQSRRNPRKLWHRQCMCERQGHEGHSEGMPGEAGSGCRRKFETTYSPERPETVYCEQCYNAEVV